MKKTGLLLIPIIMGACNGENTSSNQQVTVQDKLGLSDTSNSIISIRDDGIDGSLKAIAITNTVYSVEKINYKNKLTEFICKTTFDEQYLNTNSNHMRTEKVEFFNYEFEKVFEINAHNSSIEIKQDYFITHSVFKGFPNAFELRNYETNEEFVACLNKCLVVEVPNKETIAHFGYSPLNFNIDTSFQIIGALTFSLNQEIQQTLFIWHAPPYRYHQTVSIRLEPKLTSDKLAYSNDPAYEKLLLWSGVEKEEKTQISGFDIILTFTKTDPDDKNKHEKVAHRISLIDGKMTGEGIMDNSNDGSGEYIDLDLY